MWVLLKYHQHQFIFYFASFSIEKWYCIALYIKFIPALDIFPILLPSFPLEIVVICSNFAVPSIIVSISSTVYSFISTWWKNNLVLLEIGITVTTEDFSLYLSPVMIIQGLTLSNSDPTFNPRSHVYISPHLGFSFWFCFSLVENLIKFLNKNSFIESSDFCLSFFCKDLLFYVT